MKAKANEAAAELASMDDEALYGKTLFTRGFGWTVENGLLTDYKVLVLAVDEAMVSGGVQNRLADGAPCERARGQAGWRPINDRG